MSIMEQDKKLVDPLATKHQKKWQHCHVLDVDDFSRDEIELVLETADAMKSILSREIKKVPTLRGRSVVTLFY
ncbi:MAG: pyrB, partial [Dehalococcoidia bacterium]|nr:pyrB [Dehalococcoidia bacterium]MBF8304266.1 pyrB [Dehalococcoidia bacterium]